jgi:hypothetical protein
MGMTFLKGRPFLLDKSGELKMPILGLRFKAIEVIQQKALSVEFDFVSEYTPNIGSIKLTGEVFYLSDKGPQIVKTWKAKKDLPEDMRVEILNHLFRVCIVRISNLADDLQLPPPMAIPRVRPKADAK